MNAGLGDELSWIKGRHSFAMGGEHRRVQLNRLDFGGQTGGTYSFSDQISPNTGSVSTLVDQIGGLITGSLNTYTFCAVHPSSADSVSSSGRTGGLVPGPVNLITNPIGPLSGPKVISRDPIFFMNNVNALTFYDIPQTNIVPIVQKWHLGTQWMVGRI